MAILLPWLLLALHAGLVAAAAPALESLVRQATACLRGHAPPPAAQPWRDLVRLWRKPALAPAGAWFPFHAAPALSLGLAAAAALLVPGFTLGMATAGATDLLVVAALLAASRTGPALAAFDAGSALAAHAGSRVAAARLPAEPVLLLAALAAVLLAGSTSLDAAPLRDGALRLPAALAGLALLAWAVHEPATPAVFAGRHLALLHAAAAIRRIAGLSAAAAVGLPFGIALAGAGPEAWVVGAACWALKLGVLTVLAAAIGPHRALLPAAAILALIACLLAGVQARV